MKVVITDDADADLQEAFDYIAPRNEHAALALVSDLEAFWHGLLSKHPLIGRPYQDNVRVSYKRGYRIYYRLGGEKIEILRVIHMSRDDYQI